MGENKCLEEATEYQKRTLKKKEVNSFSLLLLSFSHMR